MLWIGEKLNGAVPSIANGVLFTARSFELRFDGGKESRYYFSGHARQCVADGRAAVG